MDSKALLPARAAMRKTFLLVCLALQQVTRCQWSEHNTSAANIFSLDDSFRKTYQISRWLHISHALLTKPDTYVTSVESHSSRFIGMIQTLQHGRTLSERRSPCVITMNEASCTSRHANASSMLLGNF